MKCPTCRDSTLTVSHEAYNYKESGLPNVTLVGLEVRRCGQCGEVLPVIPRIAELHQVIAQAVVEQRSKLTGAEIRFVRKYLGYSGEDFARIMGVTRETLSRWENDSAPIGASADRLLRLLFVSLKRVENYHAAEVLPQITEEKLARNFRVSRAGKDWQMAAAQL